MFILINVLNEHELVVLKLWFLMVVIVVLLLPKGLYYDEILRKFL